MLHLSTVDKNTYELLQKLSVIDIIKSNFAFAGGTSLALQIGHRKSIDLDFFSPASFDVRELEITLAADPTIHFQFISSNSRMLFCYINSIKCDFVNEPARLINSFLYEDKVRYFSIADIAAMKMHTICGRGKKKDFFDIYALLELYTWEHLIHWFQQKYDEEQLYFFYGEAFFILKMLKMILI
jgi:predicted nucleotidyltransferase component of viral defense system